MGLNNLYGLYGSQSVSVLGVGGGHRTCREVRSVSCSCLLSSGSLLSPDPKFQRRAHTHSSCRRDICRPCRCRSQGSCRSRLPGREKPAVSRGEDEPLQTSAGPFPSSWVSTSPGSSSPAQNRQKAHSPATCHPASLPFGAKGTVLYLPPRRSPGSSAHSGSLGLMARTFCLSPEEAISPPHPALAIRRPGQSPGADPEAP